MHASTLQLAGIIPRRWQPHWPWTLILTGLLTLTACQTTDRQELAAANPLNRAQAIVRLAEQRDPEAVHKLIDLLNDPDRGVRMYAILGLERMIGKTFGYKYYAPESARLEAIERWRTALRAGELVVRRGNRAPRNAAEPGS